MIVNSLKELEKELKKRIDKALKTEVQAIVTDIMIDHIVTDVYEAYEPERYWRRLNQTGLNSGSPYDDSDNTGLLDPENIQFTFDGNGNMIVENVTVGARYYYGYDKGRVGWHVSDNAGKYITPVIETGNGYDVFGDGMIPRPFMQNTRDDLEKNHYVKKALKIGLKEQGLEVK